MMHLIYVRRDGTARDYFAGLNKKNNSELQLWEGRPLASTVGNGIAIG
jgi:hypothetical protein